MASSGTTASAGNLRNPMDDAVPYKDEYFSYVPDAKRGSRENEYQGRCPFPDHNDSSPSFSFNVKTGQFHCFGCGKQGGFAHFYALANGLASDDDAKKAIYEKYNIQPANSQRQKRKKKGSYVPWAENRNNKKNWSSYTIEEYSFQKHLPVEWLETTCKLSTILDSDLGITYVKFPYYGVDGKPVRPRWRYGPNKIDGEKDVIWGPQVNAKTDQNGNEDSDVHLYGEWQLAEMHDATGFIVICEGESDAQTLWYLGIPALGSPGATMFQSSFQRLVSPEYLYDIDIFIHKENDKGGPELVKGVTLALKDKPLQKNVYKFECCTLGEGIKDPSDVLIKYGKDEARKKILALINAARSEPLDLKEKVVDHVIKDAPLHLNQAEDWNFDDSGIYYVDEKTFQKVYVCPHPVLITKRMCNIESGEERVEISFKRDGHWKSGVFPRSTISQSRNLESLINLGCMVNSNTASRFVNFMAELEKANLDVIPLVESTSTFGWKSDHRFVYDGNGDIQLDLGPNEQSIARGYGARGSEDEWIKGMKVLRLVKNVFRFILAASFAAPLLRIADQRGFVVYNWGNSRGGKTSALQAALSVWGNPKQLMVNFNATQVGLERTAAFCCDLPMGVDERQLAGNNQGTLEKIVYMLAGGTGRVRGSKGGGLQTTYTWRTIGLMTGEEPIARSSTQTGVRSRTIELYGSPFAEESDAADLYDVTAQNYGRFGPKFIQRVIEIGDEPIQKAIDLMLEYVKELPGGDNGSHAQAVAVVATADAMADSWFFQPSAVLRSSKHKDETDELILGPLGICRASWSAAKSMAREILSIQEAENSVDVNEEAVSFVNSTITANLDRFHAGEETAKGEQYGVICKSERSVYFLKPALKRLLEENGFSYDKTLRYMDEQGLIQTTNSKKSKNQRRRDIQKRIGGARAWVIAYTGFDFDLPPEQTELQSSGEFQELQGDNEDLPFP